MNQYGQLLTEAQIEPDPMPASPPPPITSENSLRRRCAFYLEAKVRRPLRRGFEWLEASGELGNWSVVSFGEGDLAQTPDNFVPDTAYFRPDLPARTRQNRAPGELKPSYKWSSSLRNSDNPVHQRKFRQPLSQVNWYMGQNNAQYGFLLTNNELVAIRRIDNGMLELSDSIPWTTSGNVTQPRLTVLLALWYLGMLASDNGPWQIQQ